MGLRYTPYLILVILALRVTLLATVQAQGKTRLDESELIQKGLELPDAPTPDHKGTSASTEDKSASISGTVVDGSGATVSGSQVILMDDATQRAMTTTDVEGAFEFSQITPGSYFILVDANGFQPFKSAMFILGRQQRYQFPKVVLSVAVVISAVVVRPQDMIAAEEIRAEQAQRLFSVIPNFYTSYVWNAAPLNTKQKFSLAVRDTFDPISFLGISVTAGVEQATNSFSEYGQGAEGYGERWGARFTDGRISDLLSHAVFPSLLHQDPRYFYLGSGSKRARIAHAISSAIIARSDSGRPAPNLSYLLGDICSGALSNAYYPPSSRGVNLVFTNAAIGLAGRAGRNIALEFFSKRLTRNARGNGKPALNVDAP